MAESKMSRRRGFCTSVLATALLFCRPDTLDAKSVIGFAVTGGTSHQSAIAQIGLELIARGHSFAMLLSSGDTLSQARLAREPFKGLKLYKFSGPPDIGTDAWLKKLDRDQRKVRSCAWSRHIPAYLVFMT